MIDPYLSDFCYWAWWRYARGGMVESWSADETVAYHRDYVDERAPESLGKYTSQELLDALFLLDCTDESGEIIDCDMIARLATRRR